MKLNIHEVVEEVDCPDYDSVTAPAAAMASLANSDLMLDPEATAILSENSEEISALRRWCKEATK